MKISIFSNDKSTAMDEIIIAMFTVVSLMVGVLLIVYKPEFWIISASNSTVFGALCVVIAVIFTPIIAYRLATNTEMNKKATEEK